MAAKTYDYLRLAINGFIEAEQTWSVNLCFKGNTNTSQDDLNTWTTAAVDDVVNWWSARQGSPMQECTADTILHSVRTYLYAAGATAAKLVAEAALPATPGTSNTPGTARDSLVVSLHAASPGPHNRGRIYVPTTGPQLGQDHQFALATATNFGNNTRDLLEALGSRNVGDIAPLPIIASSQPGYTYVTSLRVDTKPDTQRRRSDKIGADGTYVVPVAFGP